MANDPGDGSFDPTRYTDEPETAPTSPLHQIPSDARRLLEILESEERARMFNEDALEMERARQQWERRRMEAEDYPEDWLLSVMD